MAKMFGSNVGLENVSSSSNRIEGACHGIPNSGNTCYIGKIKIIIILNMKTYFSGNRSMSEQSNCFKNILH